MELVTVADRGLSARAASDSDIILHTIDLSLSVTRSQFFWALGTHVGERNKVVCTT
jgi:hypothetical protein